MTHLEIALTVLVVLNIAGMAVLHRKALPGNTQDDEPSAPMPGLRPAHDPNIHIVERQGEKIVIAETLRGGMLDPANHARVGAVLASGNPNVGIQWHGGESNIEWAEKPEFKV